MFNQGALYLERPNAVRGARDHIIGAADEPEVTVLVRLGTVTGHVPAVAKHTGGGLRVPPVLLKQAERPVRFDPHGNGTDTSRWQSLTGFIDHSQVDSWRRQAHRTGANFDAR